MGYQEKPPLKAVVDDVASDVLMHYGKGHKDGGHSGRYPWGSGDNPFQRDPRAIYNANQKLKEEGVSEKERADYFGFTIQDYRTAMSYAKNNVRRQEVAQVKELVAQGKGATEIGKIMGKNESSIRELMKQTSEDNMNRAMKTADILKKRLDETGGYLEVGKGVEHELGVTRGKLDEAIFILEQDGYQRFNRRIDQVTNKNSANKTTISLLCPPGTEYKDIYAPDALKKIHSTVEYTSNDEGKTFKKKVFEYPTSLDSSRLMIRYDEDGGTAKDGVIELRRGVEDLSLGESKYAQVRIAVDGKYYLKGMAVYSDDMPDGIDVIFNSNKKKEKGMAGALKELKKNQEGEIDKDNPFGALIKPNGGQYHYTDANGKDHLSPINKTREEGEWSDWTDTLPSQFLAKQSMKLINTQLDMTKKDKQLQLKEIMEVTNPTVKKNLLKSFADECDSAAEDLKAMALPSQKWHVILPITSLKDNEVYAPGYKDGETVALVRYPHGGTFEIPICTVNNKNKEASKVITKTAIDAVGINANVAGRLSGADFDGDTVMVIPCNSPTSKIKIVSKPNLKGLEGFEPKSEYSADKVVYAKDSEDGKDHYYQNGIEFKIMKDTQKQMGVISNLIMDMTLKYDATEDELARAVRHSMVVIDAEKHKLNWQQSKVDNGIDDLIHKYQAQITEDGKVHYGGASTLITRAKSQTSVVRRQGQPHIDEEWDPETKRWIPTGKSEGKLYYKTADDAEYSYVDKKTGEVVTKFRSQQSTKMKETDDALTLLSQERTPQEIAYGNYANSLKAMANEARKEYMVTKDIPYNSKAKEIYQAEYDSLMSQLKLAEKNAPKERIANTIANSVVAAKENEYPYMTAKEKGKIAQQALVQARQEVGAERYEIKISEREWEAIQSGAIAPSNLAKILDKTDGTIIKQYATPRTNKDLTATQIARIEHLSKAGLTLAQISEIVGCSPTTVSNYTTT